MLADAVQEEKRRKVMIDRLLLYSCVTYGQRAGLWDMPDHFDEATLRRGRRRLEEFPTHELEQTISQLFMQAQQVYILSICKPKGQCSLH